MTRTDPRLADFQAVLFDMDGTLVDCHRSRRIRLVGLG